MYYVCTDRDRPMFQLSVSVSDRNGPHPAGYKVLYKVDKTPKFNNVFFRFIYVTAVRRQAPGIIHGKKKERRAAKLLMDIN